MTKDIEQRFVSLGKSAIKMLILLLLLLFLFNDLINSIFQTSIIERKKSPDVFHATYQVNSVGFFLQMFTDVNFGTLKDRSLLSLWFKQRSLETPFKMQPIYKK